MGIKYKVCAANVQIHIIRAYCVADQKQKQLGGRLTLYNAYYSLAVSLMDAPPNCGVQSTCGAYDLLLELSGRN